MSLFDAQSRADRLQGWLHETRKRKWMRSRLSRPDGARRENKLDRRVRFTESQMTQMLRTKKEIQFNHYSGVNEVSSVAFVDDDQWRINH